MEILRLTLVIFMLLLTHMWDFYTPQSKEDPLDIKNYGKYHELALKNNKKLYVWIDCEPKIDKENYHIRAKSPIWDVTKQVVLVGIPKNGQLERFDIEYDKIQEFCPT